MTHPAIFEVQPFAGSLSDGPQPELDSFELDEFEHADQDEFEMLTPRWGRRQFRSMPSVRGRQSKFGRPVSASYRNDFRFQGRIPNALSPRIRPKRSLWFQPVAPIWTSNPDLNGCMQDCMSGASRTPADAVSGGRWDEGTDATDAGDEETSWGKDIVMPWPRAKQAPAANVIDLTAKADPKVRKGLRDPAKVDTLVLHQMACCVRRKDPLRSYLSIASHFVILADGRILQLHPINRNVWASHGFNGTSVAVEFAGNFPDTRGKWWRGETFGRDRPTAAQFEAGRALVRHLKNTMGLRRVVTHRQSYGTKENDPGPDIWREVGQWAVDRLGLSDGGHGFKIGSGKPIPDAWRSQPHAVMREMSGAHEFALPVFEEVQFDELELKEAELDEVGATHSPGPAGLMTLPQAISHPRAQLPGLYQIYKGGRAIYHGQTNQISRRIQEHLLCLTRMAVDVGPYRVRITPLAGREASSLRGLEKRVGAWFARRQVPLTNRREMEVSPWV